MAFPSVQSSSISVQPVLFQGQAQNLLAGQSAFNRRPWVELRPLDRDPCLWQADPECGNQDLLLLPDLVTLPPEDLRLVAIQLENQERLLVRFSNLIWNRGIASLEVHGQVDPQTSSITVTQHYSTIGGKNNQKRVGEFIFHPEHDHWHLAGFASYEVWSLTPAGDLDQQQSISGKVSYCLMDTDRGPAESPIAKESPKYTTCTTLVQGISPGWVDTYQARLPGQWVEITGLPDGNYALVSTVDPLNLVVETDDRNNQGITYFELQGRRILSTSVNLPGKGLVQDG